MRAAESAITLAGSLRNADAVAAHAQTLGNTITVIACGERWEDESLRPAVEDFLGAGAVINALEGDPSPEAALAASTFNAATANLSSFIKTCASGRELIDKGYRTDVDLAAQLNVSTSAPQLIEDRYIDRS